MLVVMPKGQAIEKERMISLYGAELLLVDPCPFANPDHFYHTAKRIGLSAKTVGGRTNLKT
ncbi:cysteine synthase [Vibrio maritimus]|uniref:Cysteine synthase n=1 Tax=Vibrio maritimus TaxID=990268 RepID=A0A090RNR1_9VIBR|nr:cysteine synthase [Vibrio maritimus]